MSSFLNILSSIGGDGRDPQPLSALPKSAVLPTSRDANESNPSGQTVQTRPLKRKGDDHGSGLVAAKIAKIESRTPTPRTQPPIRIASPVSQTSRAAVRPILASIDSKSSDQRISTDGRSETTSVALKSAPKGSYREIMARAEAAKKAQADFGKIKHKPVERSSKKERQAAEDLERSRPKSHHLKNTTNDANRKPSRPSDPATNKKPVARLERKRTPVDLGYRGTMKPQLPGNIGGTASGTKQQVSGLKALPNRFGEKRYTYASDDDDDEDGYDEDEGSDDSAGMEGGGFDELEAEEQASLRAAKVEDDRAMREESEHRRQKLERKRKLQQLAARSKSISH